MHSHLPIKPVEALISRSACLIISLVNFQPIAANNCVATKTPFKFLDWYFPGRSALTVNFASNKGLLSK
jgi:hypothetical protein